MKRLTPLIIITVAFVTCNAPQSRQSHQEKINKQAMAQEVKEAFLHAWNGYKTYAWGHDALKPLSKTHHDWYAYSLYMTPLDAFDTMLFMDLEEEAEEAKKLILENLSFNHDMSVQVFEIVIRVLGGLITAYQMDGDPRFLELAEDLGNRLMPVFDTPTGMPCRYVNLVTGVIHDSINNPAEIGTLILEFGTLSKLTGNPEFYDKPKKAVVELFSRHSDIGLPGTFINVETGEWTNTESHISGCIDSYYEYLLKAALLFDDHDFMNMWEQSIKSVNTYLSDTSDGEFWYRHVNMNTGKETSTHFGALDAFMPGLLCLGGFMEEAKALQESCYKMWTDHIIEPELFNYKTGDIIWGGYVLRPENIESATYLYHKTGDKKYLEMGKTMFDSIIKYCITETGFAAIKDVRTMEKRDQMESFFLAETLKYAYLLFADIPDFDFNKAIFNTEAHLIHNTFNN